MAVGEARDRRGRRVRGSSGLLEREDALEAIETVLDAAGAGAGLALLLVGHPGMGKTRLHEASLDGARDRGLRVLRAAGTELEQNLAFGIAAQVARASLSDLKPRDRRAILEGTPALVQGLLGSGLLEPAAEPARDLAVSHALFSLMADALESGPGLLAIDDLHWSDPSSLEFVLYLLQRLDELPLSIAMTMRPGLHEEVSDLLDVIATHRHVRVETLTPLGSDAVHTLVKNALGQRAERGLVQVCEEATAGNPFYVHELLLALQEEQGLDAGQLTEHARSLAPDAVTRSVRVRVGRLGPDAGALARAVAVLGEDVPVRHAAALADLDIDRAGTAADALASVEVLLAREPLRFVHPLVRHSVERDIPASELATQHLNAAALLDREHADAERVAAHLLVGRAQGDQWVVQRLRTAAEEAAGRGAFRSAVRYLERALAEPPSTDARGDVLAELGSAEASLGLPEAADHLAAAAQTVSDPHRRAQLALRRGHALHAQGLHEQSAAAYEAGLTDLGGKPEQPDSLECYDALQTGFVATAALVPALQAESVRRSSQLVDRALSAPRGHGPRTQGQRQLLAQAAIHASFAGRPAQDVAELAEQAWEDGRLLEAETADGIAWTLLTTAFTLAGELERAIEVSDVALADARRISSPRAFATASYVRGLPGLWQGHVSQAMGDLEAALDTRRFGWRQFGRAAAAHYALCLLEVGALDRAEETLANDAPARASADMEDAVRMYALAELRRHQGRFPEALDTALAAGELAEQHVPHLGYAMWRGSAAQSALALGDEGQARRLAQEMVERAERTGVLHQRIRALRVHGLSLGGPAGLQSLQAAVEFGLSAPPRLETIRALIELGSALRRANERAAAREPLQRAADLANEGGASALYERARVELSASGGRPRREALLSGPASLTPSERRIAELAAAGQSNRQIAQALFVTPKTVEYHLRNAYRKLGIQGRGGLAEALTA
jgi:DNA-binding CsgD family transcriptional regulator